jgi:ribonuclease J
MQHGKLAREAGIPEQGIAVVENGYPLLFEDGCMRVGSRTPGGYVFVEGSLVGETTRTVLDQRGALGQNGLVSAVVRYRRRTGRPIGRPRVATQGFAPDVAEFLARVEQIIHQRASVDPGTPAPVVERDIEQALSDFFYEEARATPVILVTVIE